MLSDKQGSDSRSLVLTVILLGNMHTVSHFLFIVCDYHR